MSTSSGSSLVSEWRELNSRHARITAALERELERRHGLSVTELEALQALAGTDEQGCRLQRLVDDVHMSQSALSRLIGRLADEGLVSRKTCEQDRRGVYACITDAGRERLEEALPTQQAVLSEFL